ncbi:MAG: YabP/YqfC family sporulation protein [Bacilli bacterium]
MINFRNLILETEFKIILMKNRINIVNYQNIIEIKDKYIEVDYTGGKVIIEGRNMSLQKMLNDEILLTGKIENVKFI